MARRNHLDDFTRGRMIGKLEEGRTVTCVAAKFGINKSVISRAWKAFQTTGEKRPIAVSKCHFSAILYSNGATSVVVYCGQTPSQRGPIRPPSKTLLPVESCPPTPPFTVVLRA
ncbi:transposable element Tcb2 transposase [Trichonephila clavipes]|nr:transposable element Tcb2 transposase [Trichonephila clavipes]